MTRDLTKNDAPRLLDEISQMGSSGSAEAEPQDMFLRRFLPLREHARALDPDVILVIGDRGAGKTELFRAIQFPPGLQSIQALSTRTLPDPKRSSWHVGYSSSGTDFPAELVFRQFSANKNPTDLQSIWLGLLIRCLSRSSHRELLAHTLPEPVRASVEPTQLKLEQLYAAINQNLEACFGLVDQIDAELAKNDQWIFINYDELDRVSAGDWSQLQTILRGLVQFWSSYVRRWKRLRPKIFLRKDLFNRVALFGPDVSKIAAQRVELVWSTRNLYALLAKRLINQSEILRGYFGAVMPEGDDRGDLGWFPTAESDEDYRKFVERICGKFMGAAAHKGLAFTWIVNHLQDGNGRVLPRSMIRLFEKAADIERTNHKAGWPTLLHHTSMRAAVDGVSESRVQEIENEEFPWIRRIREKLQSLHPQVPIDRREIEQMLVLDWHGSTNKPPETSGHALLQLLMELGIFYLRGDGRVDVRDLYLKGFGLKRRGGIARPF